MANPAAVNAGHAGANQDLSTTGVIGTLGTADTSGTSQPLPASVDAQTGGWNMVRLGAAGVVLSSAVAVANGTATAIPATALANRKALIFYNSGTTTVYWGGSGVTGAGNGLPVGTAAYSSPIAMGAGTLYAIASAAGGTVIVGEVS